MVWLIEEAHRRRDDRPRVGPVSQPGRELLA
jgi:hypothetical protein